MKNKCKFKWNSGNLSLNCSKCGKIIKVGYEFTPEETLACCSQVGDASTYLSPQYCENCLKIK